MMKRDLNTRPTFSPFLPPQAAVALPFETLRMELHPQSQPASTVAQPIRFNLPRHGILASIELEFTITVTNTAADAAKPTLWTQGIAAKLIEYCELLNSQGLSINRLHGEGFGFFDIRANKMLNEDQFMLEEDHNYAIAEERVANADAGGTSASPAPSAKTKTFALKIPFWFCDSPSRSLPLQFMNGETIMQLQLRDLQNVIEVSHTAPTYGGGVVTQGFTQYTTSQNETPDYASSAVTAVSWGPQAIKAYVTYYVLPESHLNQYRAAMLSSVNEWPCNDETRQLVTWKATADSATGGVTPATFKLDGIHGLASSVQFAVYNTRHKQTGRWNENLIKLTNIELMGSGKSILGPAKITHEHLKKKIQRGQYGFSYANKKLGKIQTKDFPAYSGIANQVAGHVTDLDVEQAEEYCYIYSFSMSPSRPELNHGVLNVSAIHNFTINLEFEQINGETYELLFMTNNRSIVRTKPEQNGTLSMSKVVEA
jgi:hypothetical protein